MPTVRRWPGSLPALVITGSAVGILIVYWHAIRFSTFTSDPANYWTDSVRWFEPFNPYHVAGFPLLLASVRGATFDVIPPTTLMTLVTTVALLLGVNGTYRLATTTGLSPRCSVAAATAYGIWPFVGAVFAGFPVADPVVLALTVWGAVWALRGRAIPAGLLLGLAAVTHKSLWPAIALLVVASFFWIGRGRRFGATLAAFAAGPLVALWIAGIASGQTVTWLAASSADDGITPLPHHSLPVFDGLFGSMVYGNAIGRARVAVVIPMFALALIVLLPYYRRWREPFPSIASVFALEILGLALVMNQHLVWSAVRFGGLLAVPAVSLISMRVDALPARRWHIVATIVVVVLVGTQLLTAWEGSSRGWVGYL